MAERFDARAAAERLMAYEPWEPTVAETRAPYPVPENYLAAYMPGGAVYTTENVLAQMPKRPSWTSPLAFLGSYQWSREAGMAPKQPRGDRGIAPGISAIAAQTSTAN
jgi:hypothetical protein